MERTEDTRTVQLTAILLLALPGVGGAAGQEGVAAICRLLLQALHVHRCSVYGRSWLQTTGKLLIYLPPAPVQSVDSVTRHSELVCPVARFAEKGFGHGHTVI